MTSEQNPGLPRNDLPNGAPPQAQNAVSPQAPEQVYQTPGYAYNQPGAQPQYAQATEQPAAQPSVQPPAQPQYAQPTGQPGGQSPMQPQYAQPTGQPVTQPGVQPQYVQINGQVYQVPPGYAYVNGQLVVAPAKKSRKGLVIGLVVGLLVVVLVATFSILFFTGVISLPGSSKASGEADKRVVTGLTQSEKEPQLIDMGNTPGKDYAFAGDFLLAADEDEVWSFSLSTQKEVWRSADPIEELDCDPEHSPWFVDRTESNPNLVLIGCSSDDETESYVVISAEDGKVVTSKELNSDEGISFMGILKDGSLVTCEKNELIRYDGVASTENKLWSQPVEECGYGTKEYDTGWLRMTWEGDDWGQLFSLQDGSQPAVEQTFIDSIEDLEENSYSFTPLVKGNFAVAYSTKTGEDTPMGHAVIVDAQGQPLSQTYDNASFSFADDERVVLVVSYDSADSYELEKSTRLDPATGQELWTNEDAEFGCALGADKQFIWGWNSPCGNGGAPADISGLVLDTNTGKTLPMGGLRGAQDIYRTDRGFIVETHNDEEENGGIKLKSFAWNDGKFVKLWSQEYEDIPYLIVHQHRLYAISPGDDNGVLGYLGYK